KLAGASRFVYFARALNERDARQVVQQAQFAERALLLVPAVSPSSDLRIENLPLTIPLTSILSWEDDYLVFDHEYIDEAFAASAERLKCERKNNQPSARRLQRLGLIEQLVGELKDHLRTARDYAFETLERTGTPTLLPKPQQDFLARKLGVHKSSVSRAMNDPEAMQLRFLWELADDVDRIMNIASNRT
ncbi:MAG: hypothetical protein NXI22_13000, partial [bacterium]|nr:hypothetical protein [bacterium]